MKSLLILVAFLGLSLSASAEVLVYRGTAKTASFAGLPYPFAKTGQAYGVFDTGTGVLRILYFHKYQGQNVFFISGNIDLLAVSAPSGGHNVSVLSSVTTNQDGNDITHSTVYLRGTERSLLVRTSPETATRNLAQTLMGNFRLAGRNGGTVFLLDQSLVFTFQKQTTVSANNSNQTRQQVLDALRSELEKKGFTPFVL